jgi:cyclopropane fatty-acyl-phospholipid synthase-like methyltransferase
MVKNNNTSSLYIPGSNYQENAPWNIDRPQPALVELFYKHELTNPVLDVGCGAGDLAISIAQRGFSILGIDLSKEAIQICTRKARSLTLEKQGLLEFLVGNGLKLSQLNRQFGSIVDTGFYHLFGETEREQFVNELFRALNLGGRYYMLGFAINSPLPNAPKQVTQLEIKQRFTKSGGWRILELRSAEFLTALPSPRDKIPATLACVEKIG